MDVPNNVTSNIPPAGTIQRTIHGHPKIFEAATVGAEVAAVAGAVAMAATFPLGLVAYIGIGFTTLCPINSYFFRGKPTANAAILAAEAEKQKMFRTQTQ